MKKRFRLVHWFYLLGLALLVSSVAGAGWVLNSPASGDPPPPTTPGTSAASPIELSVVCFGLVDVEPGIAALFPTQQGRVIEVLVKENETVKAGAVLLRLDDELARLKLREAQAALDEAQATLAQARKLPQQKQAQIAQLKAEMAATRVKLDAARDVLKQTQEYVSRDLAKPIDVTLKEADVRQLESALQGLQGKLDELELLDPENGIRRAQAEVQRREVLVEVAQNALDRFTLRAPGDGTILRVLTQPGEVFGPQSRTPAFQFAPKGPLIVRAEVEQEFVHRVTVGQTAVIQDHPNHTVLARGKVTRMAESYMPRRSLVHEPFQLNDVRTLECTITLDPDHAPLRLHQRVRVMIGHPKP